jgi:hypothetical protein
MSYNNNNNNNNYKDNNHTIIVCLSLLLYVRDKTLRPPVFKPVMLSETWVNNAFDIVRYTYLVSKKGDLC